MHGAQCTWGNARGNVGGVSVRHLHELDLLRSDVGLRLDCGEGARHSDDGPPQQAAVDTPHLTPEGRLHVLEDAAEREVLEQLEHAVLLRPVKDEALADLHLREVLADRTEHGAAVLGGVGVGVGLDGRPAVGLACDPPVGRGEELMRQPERVAALANLDRLEDSGVGELLDGHLHLQLLRRLDVIGFDASDEVWLGLLHGGH